MNRKELIQNYKDAPSTAGVYLIKNTNTNKYLIQSATNPKGAINRHLFELKYGQHRNRRLQQDWNDSGESAFEFSIINTVKPDEMNIQKALDEMLEASFLEFGVTDENSY